MSADGQSSRATDTPAKAVAVRTVTPGDIIEILGAALRDFRAAVFYDVVLGGVYAVGGWVLIVLLLGLDLPFLVYPLAAGFALIAPFVAASFYAVSRILERGEPLTWGAIFASVRRAATSDLGWMAIVTGFSLFIWLDIAALMFFGFIGISGTLGPTEILRAIFTTPAGLAFLAIGHVIGAMIAFAVFSISVTSFPMLFDREIDFVTAMVTSVKVVTTNRSAMILWCAIIAALVGVSLLSGLVGLFVILPVLGHASWHLYRRALPS